MSLSLVLAFIEHRKTAISKDDSSIDSLAKTSSPTVVAKSVADTATDTVFGSFGNSPLVAMGKDWVAEQVSKNGAKILNNVDTIIGDRIGKTVTDAQNLVFDSIGAALTAKNDLALFFLQNTAKECVVMIRKKREILLTLKEKLRLLYNALVILVAGNPFFSKYLANLRRALGLIFDARNQVTLVRNTLQARDMWLKVRFEEAKTNLKSAEKLLQPPTTKPLVRYDSPGLLTGVNTQDDSQQAALIMSIPQLGQEVLAAATGYFAATFKLNALLLAFIQGNGKFTAASSKKLKEYSISTLDNLISQLDSLINSMGVNLNGGPNEIIGPIPGFKVDSVKTSGQALGWLMQLKTIIEYAGFVPGPTLQTLNVSNSALAKYNTAVTEIKKKGRRVNGNAVLEATEGREEPGQLESQIQTFYLASLQAIVSGKAAESILALGRTLQQRLDLSLAQDQEIEAILTTFINADLGFDDSLKRTGEGIFKMLDNFGLDRAASLLREGGYEEFFNLNSKTATYAGAALVGLAALKECLETEEDREQLTQAEREIQRDSKAKELMAQRSAGNGFAQQKQENKKAEQRLDTIADRAAQADSKCILDSPELQPANMLKNLGGVIGVGAVGSITLPNSLKNLGKGIL